MLVCDITHLFTIGFVPAKPIANRNLEKKMRTAILVAALVCFGCTAPAWAKNFAFPEKNPVGTVSIPDSWKTEEIDYGYSAKSSDGEVFFYVEYAGGPRVDKMLDNNTEWLKENKITPK